jgi:hypothetical protein
LARFLTPRAISTKKNLAAVARVRELRKAVRLDQRGIPVGRRAPQNVPCTLFSVVITPLSIAAATRKDLPDVARVHVASWRQTYAGLVPQSYLDSLDVAARLQKWREIFEQDRRNDLFGLFVARIGGAPAGFISFGPGRDEDRWAHAEIYAIHVLKQHSGNGVG